MPLCATQSTRQGMGQIKKIMGKLFLQAPPPATRFRHYSDKQMPLWQVFQQGVSTIRKPNKTDLPGGIRQWMTMVQDNPFLPRSECHRWESLAPMLGITFTSTENPGFKHWVLWSFLVPCKMSKLPRPLCTIICVQVGQGMLIWGWIAPFLGALWHLALWAAPMSIGVSASLEFGAVAPLT